MGPIEWMILGFGIAIGCTWGLFAIHRLQKKHMRTEIEAAVRPFFSNIQFSWHPGTHFFHLEIQTEETSYLVKVIRMNSNHELILTNPRYWCVNDNPRDWKRQSRPNLIPGVESFLNYRLENSQQPVKIALIYPGCHNISRYLNESDVELVSWQKSVNGIHFVRKDELPDFFGHVERK
jgi:hypothetical protein